VTVSPGAVQVTVSGPMPVLTRLRPQDVQVAIDATGLIVGTHNVKPTVSVPSLLKVVGTQPADVAVTVK